jgi:hypothetical protein
VWILIGAWVGGGRIWTGSIENFLFVQVREDAHSKKSIEHLYFIIYSAVLFIHFTRT